MPSSQSLCPDFIVLYVTVQCLYALLLYAQLLNFGFSSHVGKKFAV